MASAETGSGKTLAFLLPIIERLKSQGATRALVLRLRASLRFRLKQARKFTAA